MDELLKLQAELDNHIAKTRGAEAKPIDLCRAIIHEAVELEDELGWKWWKTAKGVDSARAKEEAIDVLHFLLSLFIKLGMDAKEVEEAYRRKWHVNMDRQNKGY